MGSGYFRIPSSNVVSSWFNQIRELMWHMVVQLGSVCPVDYMQRLHLCQWPSCLHMGHNGPVEASQI